MPKKAKADTFRRDLRRLGIYWPGDDGYAHGVAVIMVRSCRIVRLVQKLEADDKMPGDRYLTEDRMIYVERRTGLGYIQELKAWSGPTLYTQEPHKGVGWHLLCAIDRFIESSKTAPNTLRICWVDLLRLAEARGVKAIVEDGDMLGLSIVLEPVEMKGKLRVERRNYL